MMSSPLKKLKRRLTVFFHRKSVSTTNLVSGGRFDLPNNNNNEANGANGHQQHYLDVNPDPNKLSFMKRSKSVFTSLSAVPETQADDSFPTHSNSAAIAVIDELNEGPQELRTSETMYDGFYQPAVRRRSKNNLRRRLSQQELAKRLSLPADMQLPDYLIQQFETLGLMEKPLSRRMRRESLSELGFGKIESYIKLDKLGEGTYATVYKGKSLLTDALVALKEIRLEHEEGAPCTAIREVSLLRDLKHANIVTLHDIIHTERSLTLVFEYLESDLKQYMEECGNILSMHNVKLFLFQLLRGLAYCHKRKVLHRDLKPQNLLINKLGELKLADFGLARAKSVPTKTYSNEVVTLWYRPPDVLLGSTEYSSHIDMWGVGCIFYEMASGRPMFPGQTVDDQLYLIFKLLGTPTETEWPGISKNTDFASYNFPQMDPESLATLVPRLEPEGLHLLKKLLDYNTKQRITASDGMRHGYFNSFSSDIYSLSDIESIFNGPDMKLHRDPGHRLNAAASNSNRSSSKRRQSMML